MTVQLPYPDDTHDHVLPANPWGTPPDMAVDLCWETYWGPIGGFLCTRADGHQGDHVAHGERNTVLVWWVA